jgi:RNA polymerase sigma factor (sigma-70 family)
LKFLKLFRAEESETEAGQLLAYRLSGELRVLGKLYQPHMEMVFAICYKYLRDEEDSKDAVMQIFEKLIADLRNHEVENLKSWLYRVASNHCLMSLRSKKVFVEIGETDHWETYSDATEYDSAIDFESDLTILEKCLRTLNEEQRLSIDLFFKHEKCYKEIAEETGYDFNKVKSYIQNGKRNLKICMDRNGGDER